MSETVGSSSRGPGRRVGARAVLAVLLLAGSPLRLAGAVVKVFADGFETGDVWAWSGPHIDTVTPDVLEAFGSPVSIAVTGNGFGASPVPVAVTCRDSGGVLSSVDASVVSWSDTLLDLDFDLSTIGPDTVCRLRLTAMTGAWADFPGLAVRSVSASLGNFQSASNSLAVARRRLVLLDGPHRSAQQPLYALGGDDGNAANVIGSIETSTADAFGQLSAWTLLPDPLGQPRAGAAGVRLGRFLYVVGGTDGASPTTTVQRAEVLDPDQAPYAVITGVQEAPSPGGLASGSWIYRVAAVFPGGDPSNPGGESLAGPPETIGVPSFANGGEVSLDWTLVAGANGYRIYRTSGPGQPPSAARLLATVAGPPFSDAGGTAGSEAPKPAGALGNWRMLASLNTARAGLAAALAPDPVDSTRWYVYALAGRDASGTQIASYEFLGVTVAPDGSQTTAASWTVGASSLSAGRARLGAWVYEDAGTTYVFAGPGEGTTGVGVNQVDRGQVAAGGDLGTWAVQAHAPAGAYFGYAAMIDGNALLVAGGQNGNASMQVVESLLAGSPPSPGVWNSSGVLLVSAGLDLATTTVNGRLVLAGGSNGGSAVALVQSASR